MDFDGDLADANLNILQFMNLKPKRAEELKFQRVITAQGGNTFDDVKQNLEEFNRLGKDSLERRAMTRERR